MFYKTFHDALNDARHIFIDYGSGQYTSFFASVGNPAYDWFLELQSLTNAEVQAMEPDVWHDVA